MAPSKWRFQLDVNMLEAVVCECDAYLPVRPSQPSKTNSLLPSLPICADPRLRKKTHTRKHSARRRCARNCLQTHDATRIDRDLCCTIAPQLQIHKVAIEIYVIIVPSHPSAVSNMCALCLHWIFFCQIIKVNWANCAFIRKLMYQLNE